jgi:hypothetical protein
MNITNGSKNQFKPLMYNDKSNKYIVSWGLKNIGDDNYQWNYEIFNQKPSLDIIKNTITGYINNQTKYNIENRFRWNNMSINLTIENQIDYKLLFDTTVLLDGSNLPEKIKFKINGKNIYYTFETIDDMKDFIIAMNNHIRECLEVGNNLKEEINYNDYIL